MYRFLGREYGVNGTALAGIACRALARHTSIPEMPAWCVCQRGRPLLPLTADRLRFARDQDTQAYEASLLIFALRFRISRGILGEEEGIDNDGNAH